MAHDPAHHEFDDSVNPGDEGPATVGDEAGSDDVTVARPDDDDHDLLTFGEAGARLDEELIKLRRRLAALREGGGEAADIDAAERRLAALEEARRRNRAPSLDDLRSSGFFGDRS